MIETLPAPKCQIAYPVEITSEMSQMEKEFKAIGDSTRTENQWSLAPTLTVSENLVLFAQCFDKT